MGCLALLVVLQAPGSYTEAAVRVEEDEAVFTVVAPGAQRVFLVGDFNNWNPTLERMDRIGDTFEVRLFMLPGSYHYKYVVDGTWMADPDNPATNAGQGSPLLLEERAGTLTLGDASATEESAKHAIKPAVRYRGAFTVDDGDSDDNQAFDFYFTYEDDRVRSSVDFKTIGESWDVSPAETEINLDRGFVELRLDKSKFVGFDNDTIWTSHDPYGLVGNVGIYDYNAGYERKGFAWESRLLLKTDFRFFYADKIEREPFAPPAVMAGDFGSFSTSSAGDTTVYRFSDSFADEDAWGMEFFTDMGSLKLGWVSRSNRGFHPGLLVEARKNAGAFDVAAYNTREYWDADVVWLRWQFARRLVASVAWGASDAHVREVTRSLSTVSTLGDVRIGARSEPFDADIPLLSSKRGNVSLDYRKGDLRATVDYLYNRFEFDPFLNPAADADINMATMHGSYTAGRWNIRGVLAYTDQDYGSSPADFHYRTPARNFWLDHRDRLDIPDLPAFDLERTSALGLSLAWGQTTLPTRSRVQPVVPLALRLNVDLTTSGFFDRMEYVASRFSGERRLSGQFYLQADVRVARYDKPSWGLRETFLASYLEAGYRRDRVEVSVGWGFDPVVLDDVINDYNDNGRQELLREAVGERPARDGSKQLGERVRIEEDMLEDFQSLLKLEVIVLF